jgi:cytochrome c
MRRLLIASLLPLALSACGGGADDSKADGQTDNAVVETTTAAAPAAFVGKDSYAKCVACHTIDKGGRNSVGPNMHGIVGRAVASVEGFSYSAAMKAKGGVWDEAALDAYIENPRKNVVGTKMSFAGISNADERKALIEYLKEQK